jgi:hypothetical protein
MDQIQRQVAEMAIRLLAVSADVLRTDPAALEEIERVATQVLKEVAALRAGRSYLPGERSGSWRIPTFP